MDLPHLAGINYKRKVHVVAGRQLPATLKVDFTMRPYKTVLGVATCGLLIQT